MYSPSPGMCRVAGRLTGDVMFDDGPDCWQWQQQLEQQQYQQENTMQWKDHGGGEFEQPPIGTHPARCVTIIDIGTQKSEYQGQANIRRQCIIGWELPNELMTEGDYAGKPFKVSKFYTASLSEKANLRKDLANWRGRDFTEQELAGFDSKNILGKCCMLSLTANDKNKIRVTGVMALPKGMKVPDQVNPTLFFSLDEYDPAVFEKLSDGYKKLIMASPEYQAVTNPAMNGNGKKGTFADMDDDIPF